MTLKYQLDNEFDLVYVVIYQKILQLSYVDKFLDEIRLRFRDAYKNQLQSKQVLLILLQRVLFFWVKLTR